MRLLSSPFDFRGEGYLGKIYRPYIQVLLTSKNIDELIPVEVLIDTGADYTLLPKKYADLLDINLLKECKLDRTYGIGGEEKIYLCKNLITLKINDFKMIIPAGFLEKDDIPPLLGRLGALEMLVFIMKDRVAILER